MNQDSKTANKDLRKNFLPTAYAKHWTRKRLKDLCQMTLFYLKKESSLANHVQTNIATNYTQNEGQLLSKSRTNKYRIPTIYLIHHLEYFYIF